MGAHEYLSGVLRQGFYESDGIVALFENGPQIETLLGLIVGWSKS